MPNLRCSEWKSAVVADEGTTSAEVDLGAPYRSLQVEIPTIDSATVSVQVARSQGGTFRTMSYISTNDGDDDPAATSASTGGIMVVFPFFGFQHLKILCGATQTTAAVTFYVQGYN
jgi:hypothetical protein